MNRAITLLFVVFFCKIVAAQQKNNFEDWSLKPVSVVPAECGQAPSDAQNLFNGDLSNWNYSDGTPAKWNFTSSGFTVKPGEPDLFSKQSFGNCQLHIEWNIPDDETHDNLNWGNSGIYFMGLYEVQIYDSFQDKHEIYYNGQAGSIYKQYAPLVNASKKAGVWQSFDIVFTAPVFNDDKSLKSPAYFTVFQNGIIIQNHVQLTGPTVHTDFTEYKYHKPKLPLMLQSHGSKVSYRNIWIRNLN